jgi:hypothetical protein
VTSAARSEAGSSRNADAEAGPRRARPGRSTKETQADRARGEPPALGNRARSELLGASAGGAPLDPSLRSRLEGSLHGDLGGVRVHRDGAWADLAGRLGARAFTVGHGVGLAPDAPEPGSAEGDRLLAHEAIHVLQGRRAPTGRATAGSVAAAEREAAEGAATWAAGGSVPAPAEVTAAPLQADGEKEKKAVVTTVVEHGVGEEVSKLAKARMTEVIGGLKTEGADKLAGLTVELHIIPKDKKLTDLAEFANLKGTKTWDGRTYDELRGVGGTKSGSTIRYAVAEEQLTGGGEQAYAPGFVAEHESGHIVEQFAMTKDQKDALKKAYDDRKAANGPWLNPETYTSGGADEYFAQSTSAWFGRPYSTSKEDKEQYTKGWLEKHDPAMCTLLKSVYR